MKRAGRLVGTLVLPLALAACGGGNDESNHDAGTGGDAQGDVSLDAKGDVEFTGATPTGVIPHGSLFDAGTVDYGPIDPDALPRCCPTLLTLADPTGDEAWCKIKGDLGALKGDGVAATWSNGVWSAIVCLEAGQVTKYHFEFPPAPQDGDAGVDGAADAGEADNSTWRVNEDGLTTRDQDFNPVNEAVIDLACHADGDAG
jgi:hypothetical protein